MKNDMPLYLQKEIDEHLFNQYTGVLSGSQIQQHIEDHIGSNHAEYLVEKITPHIKKKKKILDIGSGYGSFVILANRNGFNTTGLELEPFECKVAQARAREEKLDVNCFQEGSALELPFPEQSFDVVTLWNVIEHITDYKKALLEVKRVLKVDGKVFVLAPNYAAFRKEAHYQLPWLPFFPKQIAALYLKAFGRKSDFLKNCIFYVSMMGIKRDLKKLDFKISSDLIDKIQIGHSFNRPWFNNFIKTLKTLNLLPLLIFLIKLRQFHPLVHSIDLIGTKK